MRPFILSLVPTGRLGPNDSAPDAAAACRRLPSALVVRSGNTELEPVTACQSGDAAEGESARESFCVFALMRRRCRCVPENSLLHLQRRFVDQRSWVDCAARVHTQRL